MLYPDIYYVTNMNLRSGKTYNYFEKCNNCQTLNKVMKRQAKADRAVSCGQISEGEYLMLSNIAKELYEWLTESCDCLEPVDEDDHRELEDGEMLVEEVTVRNGLDHGRVILRSTEPDDPTTRRNGESDTFAVYNRETLEEIGWATARPMLIGPSWTYHFTN